MTLLIKNAQVFKGNKFEKSDVLIKDSKIHTLGTSISSDDMKGDMTYASYLLT